MMLTDMPVQPWWPHHDMMEGMWGWHFWGWGMMLLWSLVWIVVIVFLIWVIVELVQDRGS